ncbi:MAG: YCF48-related protein [Nitrososphaera sp.]
MTGVFFTDSNTGTVVGLSGTILRTTNGGASWSSQSSEINDFYGVSFFNANIGAVVGNGIILHTSNGGATWRRQIIGTTLRSVSCPDVTTCIAVGDGGVIVRTTNAGQTWVADTSGTTNALLGVFFTSANTGTVVGEFGAILRTSGGMVAVRENPGSKIEPPNQFVLEQNYPNPFNPMTTISFALPKSEFVTLKVYDVNGQEITTLVNEPKAAGDYKVSFDASKFSNGVYFYRLQVGSFVQLRKMLLLK